MQIFPSLAYRVSHYMIIVNKVVICALRQTSFNRSCLKDEAYLKLLKIMKTKTTNDLQNNGLVRTKN